MSEPIRSSRINLYAKKGPQRSYAERQIARELNRVDQALVSARAEIEAALRRFAARVQEQERSA